MAKETLYLVGDFETTKEVINQYVNSKGEIKPVYKASVWASCIVEVETNQTLQLSNNIEDTMDFLKALSKTYNVELYYHNLKFDGQFIINWLLSNGFEHNPKLDNKNCFDTLITSMGVFYQITIKYNKGKNANRIVIRDSLKILPLKVKELSSAYNLKMLKGDIDYNKPRNVGKSGKEYIITEEEREYIEHDCKIVAQCLKQTFSEGHTKMTASSNAMAEYKEIMGKTKFKCLFPNLDMKHKGAETVDKFIRTSYKGGYTYVNPKYQNKVIKEKGKTYDVNSLYPSVMYTELLPYGMPLHYKGEYKPNNEYPLYIQRLRCRFKLKKGHIPTVQIKGGRFAETEYLKSSIIDGENERVTLTMSNVDLETFKKHYNITNLEYIEGYMFKGKVGMFKEYIDKWAEVKKNSTGGLRTIAKLMLNSLYGKFASSVDNELKVPFLENGVVKFEEYHSKERKSVYTAMASFITSYARRVTQVAFQNNIDVCCYCDTDSIHILGNAKDIEIHDKNLGAWKLEGEWLEAKFIRAKTYYEELTTDSGTHLDIKCAGMPQNCKKQVTKETFKIGYKVFGKLIPIKCLGGVVLEENYFTIK